MKNWSKTGLISLLALTMPITGIAQIDAIYTPEKEIIDPVLDTTTNIIDYPTLIFPNDIVVVDTTDPATDNITTPPDNTVTPEPEPDPYDSTGNEPDESGQDPYYEDPDITTEPEPETDPRDPYYPPENDIPPTEPEPDPTGTYIPPVTTTDRPTYNGIRPLAPRPTPEEEEPEQEECPEFDPMDREPVECPKAEHVPVLPIPPYILLLTPVLAVLLFWAIISYLSRSQNKVESVFQQKHLQNARTETVNKSKIQNYQELLDFLSSSNTSSDKLDQKNLQPFLSKIELLGSDEMRNLGEQAQTAFNNNDKQALKPLLKNIATQIRLENK